MRMVTRLIESCPYSDDDSAKVKIHLIRMRCCVNIDISTVLMVVCVVLSCPGVMPTTGWARLTTTMRFCI